MYLSGIQLQLSFPVIVSTDFYINKLWENHEIAESVKRIAHSFLDALPHKSPLRLSSILL